MLGVLPIVQMAVEVTITSPHRLDVGGRLLAARLCVGEAAIRKEVRSHRFPQSKASTKNLTALTRRTHAIVAVAYLWGGEG
jgi:hypothetical protein